MILKKIILLLRKKCLSIKIYGWLGKCLKHNHLKKIFNRNLNIDKGITAPNYMHEFGKDFKMKSVGKYHDLYI